jgi:type IV pilus assembly protein PilM
MDLLHGVGDFFSLDIGTNSMRLVQLSGNVRTGWTLQKFAYVPIDAKLSTDTSELGKRHLGEAIMGAVEQAGIKTRSVAVGIPATKTFTSVVETDTIPEKELKKAFKYEIDKYVPMAISDAKADFIILGPSPNNPAKTEVLVSSVAKKFAEDALETIEKTGLDIIAMEPEPLAMSRALAVPGAIDATLIVDFGERSSDLVVSYHNQPRLVRSIPGGITLLVHAVATTLGVREDQARQFILKFGLDNTQVEGQVFRILNSQLETFATELAKSVRFFQSKYLSGKIGGIVLSGYASIIPLFTEFIEAKTNIPTVNGNPWQFVRMTAEQQTALAPVASEFAVCVGLSERSNN